MSFAKWGRVNTYGRLKKYAIIYTFRRASLFVFHSLNVLSYAQQSVFCCGGLPPHTYTNE